MIAPPIPKNEKERLAELLQYDILDTPQEEELNEIVTLASSICKMPMSLISLIDEDRQWFKAKVGLAVEETPRELAFCAYAINGDEIFSVPDAHVDDRFTKNPMVVGDPNIRFYAGVPLTTPGGYNLGTLCVIDREPRTLSGEQQVALRTLARQVVTHFELRKKNRKLHSLLKTIDQQKAQLENHNQVLARLLSIISHDLRTPVENLKQLFNMFISGELTTEELAMLGESLNKSLNTTSELLQNLLSWASSQLKDAGLNISNINLHELVNEQLHAIELSARTKQNTLINEVKPGTRIHADSDILKFVVRNLVINANKFTVHGKVKISFDADTYRHRIKVADTGRGMSQEAINRLFNWKNRQTSDGTAGEKGSGLGLLITKQFAVQHGGDLIFESKEGEGTTVTFEISSQLASEQQL